MIADKVAAGSRISFAEGLELLRCAPLGELGALAQEVRYRKNPRREVTFVIDSNPNYSNVCVTGCSFCAFYRRPGAAEAYTLSVDEVMARIATAASLGATTVLLQGGHHPELGVGYYEELVRRTRAEFPQVTPHFFTPSEVANLAEVEGMTVREVLERLWAAGQRTLPGGGAEILSDRVRRRISPRKGPARAWLDVMEEAHRIGFRSTATMMFGHVEEDEDIMIHLEHIRSLQDRTGGFTAFVPWSFKPGNTGLRGTVPTNVGAARYLRVLAVARVYLDNFDHVQASWFSEGKKAGQIALHFGADDFGGTLFEESVHLATGHENRTTAEEVAELIREAGFCPVQRTTLYERVRCW